MPHRGSIVVRRRTALAVGLVLASGGFAELGLSRTALAQPSPNVVTADPLTPAEQQAKFKLPEGFAIDLVASEPDIGKPINLAFDRRGRLLVTHSVEYPFAAKEGAGRDAVSRFSDTDGDGRLDRAERLVPGLNIPIGLLPLADDLLVYTIPQIERWTPGEDGRLVRKGPVLTGFGFDDTHGMNNALRRGLDDWIHVAHGFRNDSKIASQGEDTLQLNSGNTYRFRPDGRRLEAFTRGQVNPFGLCFDAWGDLYSADCHSKPAYLLLRGAHYPSFGKPHDGLGFAPEFLSHSHGSTAISGIVVYEADRFPEPYRGTLFLGNPVTNRINHDRLERRGSGWKAVEQPDFLRCEDQWFRPVDLALGPDGALYVADFYNRIIGHYEVPLTHPQRDRERGRIWRIRWVGTDPQARVDKKDVAEKSPLPDLAVRNAEQLWDALGDPNLAVRTMATHELVDRFAAEAGRFVAARIAQDERPERRAHGLWVLERTKLLDGSLRDRLVADAVPLVRVHAQRVLAGRDEWTADDRRAAIAGTADEHAAVRRAATDGLGRHPHPDAARALLRLLARIGTDAGDPFLSHTARMALRDQFVGPHALGLEFARTLDEADSRRVADVSVGLRSELGAALAVDHLKRFPEADPLAARLFEHAVQYAPVDGLPGLVQAARKQTGSEPALQLVRIGGLADALDRRGAKSLPALRDWALESATAALRRPEVAPPESRTWTATDMAGAPVPNRWGLERRKSPDGAESQFLSSLPGGESLTGRLRSPTFRLPARLAFDLCGHLGLPQANPHKETYVRLLAADTGAMLREARPPRNDVAVRIEWDLKDVAGKQGRLELVDGNGGGSFAWLAVGKIDPAVVALDPADGTGAEQSQRRAVAFVGRFRLELLTPTVSELLAARDTSLALRSDSAKALAVLRDDPRLAALAEVVGTVPHDSPLGTRIAGAFATGTEPAVREKVLAEVLRAVPQGTQQTVAQGLATSRDGGTVLLAAIEAGHASPRLLQVAAVRNGLLGSKAADDARLAKLTANLVPLDQVREQLLKKRRDEFESADRSPTRGQAVFRKHCQACHKLGEEGAKVGPQLDGIGQRGTERLFEDLLDPNRNVDPAFRAATVVTKAGKVLTGLVLSEEGEVLTLADAKGEKTLVPKREIEERKQGTQSAMPANFGELLPAGDVHDLVEFLRSQRAK